MRIWQRGFLLITVLMVAEIFLVAHSCAQAQELPAIADRLPTEKARVVRLGHFERAPQIDGRLDEEVWQRSAVLKDFYQIQPGDNTQPSYPTEVLLGCDERFLYLGIKARDEAERVRATLAKRDEVLGDDHVRVYLDTFNDKRRAYVLVFNALGVQQDGIFTEGSEPDYSVDLVMESKGVLTADGYTIEVAIPFRSLRYETGGGKSWGIQVVRKIRRFNDEEDSWLPLVRGKSGFLSQAGQLTGLEAITTERDLEIIPSLTVSETGRRARAFSIASLQADPALLDPGRFLNRPVELSPGLTLKFGITPNVTLDLAVNPDFAQVEADQPVVTANQRFPLFFAEKRPFFLEGIDIFQTPLRAVHTRTIVDPDWALKLSGKRGRNTFGLLMASDKAPGNFSEEERTDPALRPSIERFLDKNASIGILRLKRDFGKESNLGFLATSYDFLEKHNHLFGVDGRLSMNSHTVLTFQALCLTSRQFFYDPETDRNLYRTGNGFGYYAQVQKTGRHLNLTLSGLGRTRDYLAAAGFTNRSDTNAWDLLVRYDSEPKEKGSLVYWSQTSASHAQFDWRGRMQYSYESSRTLFNFKRQTYLKIDLYRDYARVFEEEYGAKRSATRAGAFLGAPERSTLWQGFTVEAASAPSKKYSATFVIDYSWNAFDYDLGAGPRFPRVSPAALANPDAPFDPGQGFTSDLNASFAWQPTDAFRTLFTYTKSYLKRNDSKRVAFDQNLYSLQSTYYFTRFTFARARFAYDSIYANLRGQFLLGWTPSPGTSFYAGYNDDVNRNGYSPFTGLYEPGLRRNRRTFFIKMSYLLRFGR
jgi:hypothetical protein